MTSQERVTLSDAMNLITQARKDAHEQSHDNWLFNSCSVVGDLDDAMEILAALLGGKQ